MPLEPDDPDQGADLQHRGDGRQAGGPGRAGAYRGRPGSGACFFYEAVADLWRAVRDGEQPTPRQIALHRIAAPTPPKPALR
jgi:hypothetical protein